MPESASFIKVHSMILGAPDPNISSSARSFGYFGLLAM